MHINPSVATSQLMHLEKFTSNFLIFFLLFCLSVLIFFIIDHSSSFKVNTCICGLSVIQVQIIFDARQLLKREVKMIYAN